MAVIRQAAPPLVIQQASGYTSARHAPPDDRPGIVLVTVRLALGLWAAAIYAIYWLGYLRGPG